MFVKHLHLLFTFTLASCHLVNREINYCYWAPLWAACLKRSKKRKYMLQVGAAAIILSQIQPLPHRWPPGYKCWQPTTIIIQQQWRTLFDICQGNLVGKIEHFSPLGLWLTSSAYGVFIASRNTNSILLCPSYSIHSKANASKTFPVQWLYNFG